MREVSATPDVATWTLTNEVPARGRRELWRSKAMATTVGIFLPCLAGPAIRVVSTGYWGHSILAL